MAISIKGDRTIYLIVCYLAYGLVKSGIKKLIDSEEGKVPSEFSCNVFHDIVLKYLQVI